MTIVVGQIEPLKKLKEILNKNGITRFNSIGEINSFLKNYESERKEIPKITENSVDEEISNLQSDIVKQQQQMCDDLRVAILSELNHKIKKLEETSKQVTEKSNKSLFSKIRYYLKIKLLTNKKSTLENNLEKIIRKKMRVAENGINRAKNKLDNYRENKKNIISTRCVESYKKLDFTK